MTGQKGRDLLLKIGNGADPENFSTLGAARTTAFSLNNQPADATTMDDGGMQRFIGDAGVQSLQLKLDGVFKDSIAEEKLRAAAFNRLVPNFELWFPNGDKYAAAFAVQEYSRSGAHDGLESFTVTLARSGSGTFTKASA
ncbi:MAG: phage tail protein [Micavibrio sp.]|nr:phage tail protein [Micavibrio sp.]